MMKPAKSLRSAIGQIEAGSKAARLRSVLPEIEQRLAAGARISDVVATLNGHGLAITTATLKSYLYRFRKAAREEKLDQGSTQPAAPFEEWIDGPPSPRENRRTVEGPPQETASTTPMLLRHINTARCLRQLRRGAMLSRADLSRELGLTRATIGHAVNELIESGLVVETSDRVEGARPGRPGSGIRLNPDGAYAIGIDISSLKLTAVMVDLGMRVAHRLGDSVEAHANSVEHVVEQIAGLCTRLLTATGIEPSRVQGVCVSVPGLVDHGGRVVVAPFLHWRDVQLKQILSKRTDLPWPITVCNDAVAFANAERTIAREQDAQNMLLILLTEGLGGAIVQRGQIFEGARGYAGELGHMVMGATPGSIASHTFELLAGYDRFRPFLPKDQSLERGLEWLASADSTARTPELEKTFDEWADVLTTGILNLVYVLDPEKIVLGGPLSMLFPRVEQRVKRALANNLMHGFTAPPIYITRLGPDGAAIGAASVVRNQLFSLPTIELE
ncbi:Transcriptional regulator/sugar kinase [Paraburkholderia caribensis MBA4]|uniref:Transcriptional regulator/sugar kinase n=1 Tax=Paraburkholderia caribensis MBA4 TaxID=1323664 RepID=A0A0P0RJ03_9BURK|nr:ROK family transcriptional regulator [Paraburkholderia caribensis]ALL68492.1 Transcriptional regulator/sugar kinase [Paraburkholderia caribensis MBA4]